MSRQTELIPEIYVAAGILCDAAGRVLIAQRPKHKPQGGAWEFPGGKLNEGELPLPALIRELREELGIEVRLARHLTRYSHDCADKRINLHFWLVPVWQGAPEGLEGQELRWLKPSGLMEQGLLPADEPIVGLLQGGSQVIEAAIENCLR